MPIPGVPTFEPVNKPQANPAEAGRVGESVSQLGEVSNDATLQQQGLNLFIKKAQEHVDTLSARNQMDAAYAQIQDQLAKTANSRDVPDVIQQGNKTLNDISAQWSKSPAAIAIQMDADSLRPGLSHVGTVKQVDLMGKELKINLNTQGEVLANDYATGNRDAATAAFGAAVAGGVTTGLLGDAEAGEYMRQFKQKGQELQIRNGITNASPEVNQKTYDDITQHRDQFPDVTQEQLDTYKGQALSAFEAHTKFQDWAEGDMARRTQLVPKIQQFTNPATGHFDEGEALKDNSERLVKGEITETQSKVLAAGFESHQAQLQVGLKQEADKRLNDVETDLSKHDFATAATKLEQNRPWFENNGFSQDYRAALNYTKSREQEVRAEASAQRAENRYEHEYQRQVAQENSQDQLGNVQHFISAGGVLTKADLQDMAGSGKGKMSTKDVDTAWKMMDAYEKQPDFAAATKYIGDSFPINAKTDSPDKIASQNRKYAQTVELFQDEVNKNPNKSKLEIAHDIMKSVNAEQIKDNANKLFGIESTGSKIGDFFSKMFGSKAAPTTTSAPQGTTPVKPKSVPDGYVWDKSGNGGKGSWKPPSN